MPPDEMTFEEVKEAAQPFGLGLEALSKLPKPKQGQAGLFGGLLNVTTAPPED
jgi:hypothetical protein